VVRRENLPRSGYTEQPRVSTLGQVASKGAPKVAPHVKRDGGIIREQPKGPPRPSPVRRFVLALVVVLVLDFLRAECWSTGVSEYCAFSELRPRSGLEVLSGRISRYA
jgi:hypothetical protein